MLVDALHVHSIHHTPIPSVYYHNTHQNPRQLNETRHLYEATICDNTVLVYHNRSENLVTSLHYTYGHPYTHSHIIGLLQLVIVESNITSEEEVKLTHTKPLPDYFGIPAHQQKVCWMSLLYLLYEAHWQAVKAFLQCDKESVVTQHQEMVVQIEIHE